MLPKLYFSRVSDSDGESHSRWEMLAFQGVPLPKSGRKGWAGPCQCLAGERPGLLLLQTQHLGSRELITGKD